MNLIKSIKLEKDNSLAIIPQSENYYLLTLFLEKEMYLHQKLRDLEKAVFDVMSLKKYGWEWQGDIIDLKVGPKQVYIHHYDCPELSLSHEDFLDCLDYWREKYIEFCTLEKISMHYIDKLYISKTHHLWYEHKLGPIFDAVLEWAKNREIRDQFIRIYKLFESGKQYKKRLKMGQYHATLWPDITEIMNTSNPKDLVEFSTKELVEDIQFWFQLHNSHRKNQLNLDYPNFDEYSPFIRILNEGITYAFDIAAAKSVIAKIKSGEKNIEWGIDDDIGNYIRVNEEGVKYCPWDIKYNAPIIISHDEFLDCIQDWLPRFKHNIACVRLFYNMHYVNKLYRTRDKMLWCECIEGYHYFEIFLRDLIYDLQSFKAILPNIEAIDKSLQKKIFIKIRNWSITLAPVKVILVHKNLNSAILTFETKKWLHDVKLWLNLSGYNLDTIN